MSQTWKEKMAADTARIQNNPRYLGNMGGPMNRTYTEEELGSLDWAELRSSQIVRAAWLDENLAQEWGWPPFPQLVVQFKGKKPSYYRYQGVPESVALSLLDVESPGRWLNASIKGVYEYKKLEIVDE